MASLTDAEVDVAQGVTLPRLRALRRRAFLTQRQVADRAGLNVVTLFRAERGEPVSLVTAQRLAEALGVEPAELAAPPDQPPR